MLKENEQRSDLRSPEGARYVIITSSFNRRYTEALKRACTAELASLGAAHVETIDVPGAMEIPVAAKLAAERRHPDAIIALGVIIKGDTYHFENIANECARGCQDVALSHGVPIIYEVIACLEEAHAAARCGGDRQNKGIEAAATAVAMADVTRSIKHG